MIKKIFIWLFISSVMVSVLVTNYRVAMLEEKMKGVYQSLANFQAERMAARRALQKETGSAIDKLHHHGIERPFGMRLDCRPG